MAARKRAGKPAWNADGVRTLRHHLGLTQAELAGELGVRQQTVSDWEVGAYQPRGASRTLLSIVAERSGFSYAARDSQAASLEDQPGKTSLVQGGQSF